MIELKRFAGKRVNTGYELGDGIVDKILEVLRSFFKIQLPSKFVNRNHDNSYTIYVPNNNRNIKRIEIDNDYNHVTIYDDNKNHELNSDTINKLKEQLINKY